MTWNKAQTEELIDGESLIDTLIECSPIQHTHAYDGLRAALNQLQRELETDGVRGKWRTWPESDTDHIEPQQETNTERR